MVTLLNDNVDVNVRGLFTSLLGDLFSFHMNSTGLHNSLNEKINSLHGLKMHKLKILIATYAWIPRIDDQKWVAYYYYYYYYC